MDPGLLGSVSDLLRPLFAVLAAAEEAGTALQIHRIQKQRVDALDLGDVLGIGRTGDHRDDGVGRFASQGPLPCRVGSPHLRTKCRRVDGHRCCNAGNGIEQPLLLPLEFDICESYLQPVGDELVSRWTVFSIHYPRLDASDIPDIYLSRSVIECAAARILAERGEVPVGTVAAIERFRAAIAAGHAVSGLVENDVEFHRALVAATKSPRLRRLHDAVIGEAHLCMAQVQIHHLLHPQVIAEEHMRILSLIAERNVSAAAAETNAHLAQAGDRLLGYLRQEPVPAESTAE